MTTLTGHNGQAWFEVSPTQGRDTPKGKIIARVCCDQEADIGGTFPARCKYAVAVTFTPKDRAEFTQFRPCDSLEAGLALISDQFAKIGG